ncbi:MAG: hypothetical protein M1812_001363 [Candelaria pacifica]|nr:MAG: hypothetical protein M1812_001363 [Candelaria pacifica]
MDDWDSPWANEELADPHKPSEAIEPSKLELQAADGNPLSAATLVLPLDNQSQPWGSESNTVALDGFSDGPLALDAPLTRESLSWELESSPKVETHTDPVAIDLNFKKSERSDLSSGNQWAGNVSSHVGICTSPSALHSDARWSTSPKLQFATVPESDVLDSLGCLNSNSPIPTPTSARAKDLIEFFEAKSGTARPGSANDDRAPQIEDGNGSCSSPINGLDSYDTHEVQALSRRGESIPRLASSAYEGISHGEGPTSESLRMTYNGGACDCDSKGGEVGPAEQDLKAGLPDLKPLRVNNSVQGGSLGDFKHSVPVHENLGQPNEGGRPETAISIAVMAADTQMASSFTANTDLVGQLFPPDTVADQLTVVTDDSLNTTSARKLWYRISRQGTMRKHDSGNEDYVRVSWVGSAVQTSINKVVASWITEDQLGGSLGSGEGNGLSSLFGWGEPPKPSLSKAVSTLERSTFGPITQTTKQSASVKDKPAVCSGSTPGLPVLVGSTLAPRSPISQPGWVHTLDLSPALSEAPALSVSCSTLSSGDTDGFSRHSAELDEAETDWKASEAKRQGALEDATQEDDWGVMVQSTPVIFSHQPHPPPRQGMPVVQMTLNQAIGPSLMHASPKASSCERSTVAHVISKDSRTPGPKSSIASIPTSPIQHTSSPVVPVRGSSRKHSVRISADYSFFDPPAQSPKSTVSPTPTSHLPLSVSARRLPKTAEEEAEEAEILRSIVRDLPDLSYMLKR